MRRLMLRCWPLLLLTTFGSAQANEATLKKVCGTCHPLERVTAVRRSKADWQESINKMVGLGAKATPEEFSAVLDYLTKEFGPRTDIQIGITAGGGGGGRGGRGGNALSPGPPRREVGMGAGANDKHLMDEVAAEQGGKIWAVECINCHGPDARGTSTGANLIQSDMLLQDRYGNMLGPFLRKGHPTQSGSPSSKFTAPQVADLSHFLHGKVYDTLRGSPIFHVRDVLTGSAKAGEEYFNGEGGCTKCHSATGDLAKVGSKYDPFALQLRFLNQRPNAGRGGRGGASSDSNTKRVTLTVTPPSGPSVTGFPVGVDDFNVAIRDSAGDYHSWRRTADLKIVKNDPYATHDEMIQKFTDKNMHDLVAYLVTLK